MRMKIYMRKKDNCSEELFLNLLEIQLIHAIEKHVYINFSDFSPPLSFLINIKRENRFKYDSIKSLIAFVIDSNESISQVF